MAKQADPGSVMPDVCAFILVSMRDVRRTINIAAVGDAGQFFASCCLLPGAKSAALRRPTGVAGHCVDGEGSTSDQEKPSPFEINVDAVAITNKRGQEITRED